jgi:GT2 family glycosyltransferase
MPTIYTIIVTYNGEKWIHLCLDSLRASSLKTKVIVVDNGSKDGTCDIIEAEYPEVQLIKSKINLGFGQGNNKGIEQAIQKQPDYLFLLNQDAWVQVETLQQLINIAEDRQDIGILSPIHLDGKGEKLDEKFSFYVSPPKCHDFISDLTLKKPLKEVYLTTFVNAAAWLIPISTLKMVGGFDPIFFHYGEDDNYVQRLRFHEFKIGIVPKASIFHDREIRPKTYLETNFFLSYKRAVILKFADINFTNWRSEFLKEKYLTWGKLMLSMVIFNFKKARYIWKRALFLNAALTEIKRSRQINKQKGLHYLNFENEG